MSDLVPQCWCWVSYLCILYT